jgi:hypothetical protein
MAPRPKLPYGITPVVKVDRELMRRLYEIQDEINAVGDELRIAHEKITVQRPSDE